VRDFEIYGSCYDNEAMRGRPTEFDQFLANYPWITEKPRRTIKTPCTTIRSRATTRASAPFCNGSFGLIHGV